jgi:hypothetical protein
LIELISLGEASWSTTFPHRVMPLQEEWLPGLLLRCDEVNHWGSGSTRTHLFLSVHRGLLRGIQSWIVVPAPALGYLAQLLAVPTKSILVTTYQTELSGLYEIAIPHPRQLNTLFAFHLCPACVKEAQLLQRTLTLPHITLCPLHHVTLMSTCQCGSPLRLFSPLTRPFTCPRCGVSWADLPKVQATPSRIALEQKIMSLYTFFFERGTPSLLAQALHLIRTSIRHRKEKRVQYLDGSIKQVEHYQLTKASLGYLVDLLVTFNISSDDIQRYEGSLPWQLMKPS